MKAFEKLEKREERRKDALARLESERSQESETDGKQKSLEAKVKTRTFRTKSLSKEKSEDSVPPTPLIVRGKEKKTKPVKVRK